MFLLAKRLASPELEMWEEYVTQVSGDGQTFESLLRIISQAICKVHLLETIFLIRRTQTELEL